MATMAVGAALSALGNTNESERSQTQAAISSNINVQITDSEAQKQKTGKTAEDTLQSLNRDVANANQKLEKQDLTKAQERQEMAQTIGQISGDWLQFAVGDKLKEANKKRQEADAIEKDNPTKSAELKAQAQAIEAEYGLVSNLQMGVRAATAALQGLATGSVNQAAVGAASPYLNKLIKEQTGDNKEANLIAHAVLGAVEAHFTGNNAAAGAVGALTAEAAAPLIMQTLYGTDNPTNLSDSQKQNVANLSQIAASLSGGLVGDSTASGIAGAEIGKRAVENNYLYVDEAKEKMVLERKVKAGEATEEEKQRLAQINLIDIARDQDIVDACEFVSSAACLELTAKAEYAQYGYEQNLSYNTKLKELYPNDYQNVLNILSGKDQKAVEFEKIALGISKQQNISLDEAKNFLEKVMIYKEFAELVGVVRGGTAVKYGVKSTTAPVNYPNQTANLSLSGAENAINAVKLKEQLSNEVLKSQGTKFDELLVSARAEIDGKVYIDTNQNAIAPILADPNKPTLIAENIANKAPAKNGGTYPNANMAEAHAEIGAIQQAYEKGVTKGKDMVIHVQGRDVCTYCRNDIATAAKKAGLKSVTVHAIDEKEKLHIYTWSSGQKSLKEVKNGK